MKNNSFYGRDNIRYFIRDAKMIFDIILFPNKYDKKFRNRHIDKCVKRGIISKQTGRKIKNYI